MNWFWAQLWSCDSNLHMIAPICEEPRIHNGSRALGNCIELEKVTIRPRLHFFSGVLLAGNVLADGSIAHV